jgi:putative MATE family efflux protein
MVQQRQLSDDALKRFLDRVVKPPEDWLIALVLSAVIPGSGIVYFGQARRGLKIFLITASLYVLGAAFYDFILTNESVFIPLIYAVILTAAISMWLYSIVITIQLYEIDLKLWQIKNGIYNKLDKIDYKELLDLLKEKIKIAKEEDEGQNEPSLDKEDEDEKEREKKEKKATLELMLNDPKRAIVYMSLIVSMTFIATKVNSFLDKMWISKISDEAVSAISTVSPIYSVVAAIGVGIGTGACICISYTLGKKDYSRSQDLANASLFLSILMSIPTALFLILSIDPIVSVQGPEITELAKQYVLPLAIGCPAIILSGVLGSLFKAEGAMKIMTMCALLSVPVNAILTPVFINYCGWGILGASAATALGSVASMLASFYFFRKGKYHFKVRFTTPKSSALREILTIGGPKAIEEALGGVIMLAQTVLVSTSVGSTALAITGLGFAFPYLMTMIPDSISTGAQPVCSAQAGAHNVSVMRSSMTFSFKLLLGLSLIPTFALLFFTEPIVSIFGNGNTAITDELITASRIYATVIPFYLLQRMCTNMLQVVRKSEISAPVYLGFGVLRLILIAVFATTVMDVVYIECFINFISAIGLGIALIYYTKKFDPNVVDEKAEKRLNDLSAIKAYKKIVKTENS